VPKKKRKKGRNSHPDNNKNGFTIPGFSATGKRKINVRNCNRQKESTVEMEEAEEEGGREERRDSNCGRALSTVLQPVNGSRPRGLVWN
jgi:hypothetical protein